MFDKISKADKEGVCYKTVIERTGLHIIAVDKSLFYKKRLIYKLNAKYGIDIIIEPIPNEFAQFELYNPDNIDVQYISWFKHDLELSLDEIITEIQQYRRK